VLSFCNIGCEETNFHPFFNRAQQSSTNPVHGELVIDEAELPLALFLEN
jgi:hypothetical protein